MLLGATNQTFKNVGGALMQLPKTLGEEGSSLGGADALHLRRSYIRNNTCEF